MAALSEVAVQILTGTIAEAVSIELLSASRAQPFFFFRLFFSLAIVWLSS